MTTANPLLASGTHHHQHAAEGGHATTRAYTVGLILSIVLTVIPFALVMALHASHTVTMVAIVGMAVAQIVVQLVFFLHMNGSSSQRWNLLAFAFTVLIVAILIAGSLWIMFHLNMNMHGMVPSE